MYTEADSNVVTHMEFDPPVYNPKGEKAWRHQKNLSTFIGFWRDHFWNHGEPTFPKKGI